MRATRVLVVDDSRDAADTLAAFLRLDGRETWVAYSGAAAVAMAAQVRPQVALLDLRMPGLDGYETARALLSSPELPGIKLIAISGLAQASDVEAVRQAGFEAHLTKPVDPKHVCAVLDAF